MVGEDREANRAGTRVLEAQGSRHDGITTICLSPPVLRRTVVAEGSGCLVGKRILGLSVPAWTRGLKRSPCDGPEYSV